jgi:hypothetical protein
MTVVVSRVGLRAAVSDKKRTWLMGVNGCVKSEDDLL